MKFDPHHPVKSKNFPWQVCCKCGLIYLNNPLTKWCIDKGCNYSDNTNYKDRVSALTKPDWSK